MGEGKYRCSTCGKRCDDLSDGCPQLRCNIIATPCNSELEARLRCVIEHLEVVANYHDAGLKDVGEHIFKACRDIAAVADEL